MKYYEEAQETDDKRPCAGLREDLKACLLATDCVRIVRILLHLCDIYFNNSLRFTLLLLDKCCCMFQVNIFICNRMLLLFIDCKHPLYILNDSTVLLFNLCV